VEEGLNQEGSYRKKRGRDNRRDTSSSSDEEKHALTDNERRSYEKARSKESRWGKKEKEWKDPLLPKSNSVYKDTLKGMLELLKQDADIKKQKEMAENPEKALLAKEQVGKMEKASIKRPSENRPGDWKCTKKDCGNINFAWRTSCNIVTQRNQKTPRTTTRTRKGMSMQIGLLVQSKLRNKTWKVMYKKRKEVALQER